MSRNSLAFRLFATAAVLVLLVLPVTAFVLISLYRNAVEQEFDRWLNLYLESIVSSSLKDADRTHKASAPQLRGPLFTIPFSGWYWLVTPLDPDGGERFSSDSLLDQELALPSRLGVPADKELKRLANIQGPENQPLRILEQEIVSLSGASKRRYSFAVAGNRGENESRVSSFTFKLITALGLLGLGLVVATVLQVKYGLRPLAVMRRDLAAIRAGDSERLTGVYPEEIAPLQVEFNALIQSNQDIVERSRTHVGNLAHALKTPLSVITNEARSDNSKLSDKVVEQAKIMQSQITHHLDRARVAARVGVIGGVSNVKQVLTPLVRTLNRIYEDRGIEIQMSCPGDIVFQGEKQDLEEMAGNLLDNACKWAKGRVQLDVKRLEASASDKRRLLVIRIDDDGPGLPEQEMKAAQKRGGRLDESKPGSGLGLSIVADLAHLYVGELKLKGSSSGGLSARLTLPSA